METIDDVLAHFGIRGMKWGVRRSRGADGTVGGEHGNSTSNDAERAKEYHQRAKTSGLHTLSNQELQHLISRMNLEQQYSKLEAPTSTGGDKIRKGQKFIREALGVARTAQEIHGLVNSPLMKDIKKATKKG